MKTVARSAALTITLLTAFLTAGAVQAQTSTPPPLASSVAPVPAATMDPYAIGSPTYLAAQARWKADLAAFDTADKTKLPGDNGVLFVGSSTIRLWSSLAQDFKQLPVVINRGFGGSTMNDCSLFARDLVVRYKPRQVLVYAGDNDLAEGRTPLQVLDSFAHLVSTVRAELPDVRITYISIKPSPSRENLMPKMRETNNIISAYLRRLPNSEYVDIFTPMMAADGRPRAELFRGDRLHLNDEGYKLWQSIIVSHLPTVPAAAVSAAVAVR